MKVKNLKEGHGKLIEDGDYPNFSISGNVSGMRRVYGEKVLLVRCGEYIYNVTSDPNIYYKYSN